MPGFVLHSALMHSGVVLAGASHKEYLGVANLLNTITGPHVTDQMVTGEFNRVIIPRLETLEANPDVKSEFELLQLLRKGHVPTGRAILHVLSNSIFHQLADLQAELTTKPRTTGRLGRVSGQHLVPTSIRMVGEEGHINCPTCRELSPKQKKFCGECGSPLVEMIVDVPGEEMTLSMVFTDLKGFSSYADRVGPSVVFPTINEVLAGLAAQVTAEEGYISGYWGDAVFAIFGLHSGREDHAQRAVRAALKMQQFMTSWNAKRSQRNEEALHLRVGINTGRVAFGLLGGPGRLSQTAIGHDVNLAARLEPLAPPDGIAISHGTWLRLGKQFVGEEQPAAMVKNISEPVRYHIIAHEKARSSRLRQRDVGDVAYAPRAETKDLQNAYDTVVEDRKASLLVLEGEGGSGKSTLAEQFLDKVQEEVEIFVVDGEDLKAQDAYRGLKGAIRRQAGIDATDEEEDVRITIDNYVDLSIHDADVDANLIKQLVGNLLGVSYEEPHPQMPYLLENPEELRKAIYQALVALLRDVASRKPLVFVMEDLHWVDNGTLHFTEYMLSQLQDSPVMVLGLTRPSFAKKNPSLLKGDYPIQKVSLSGLSDEISAAMIHQVLRGQFYLEPAKMAWMVQQAGGNPLLVISMARAVLEGSRITPIQSLQEEAERKEKRQQRTTKYQLVAPGEKAGDKEIPLDIEGLLSARIGNLEANERSVLQAAAIIGEIFTAEGVTALANADVTATLDALCTNKMIVAGDDGTYQFQHALLRDAAAQDVKGRHRQRLNRLYAQHLVDAGSIDYATIATHFEDGGKGQSSTAAKYYYRAAEAAERAGAYNTATQFYAKVHVLALKGGDKRLAFKGFLGQSAALRENRQLKAIRRYRKGLSVLNKASTFIDSVEIDKELRAQFYYQKAYIFQGLKAIAEAEEAIDHGLSLFADNEHTEAKCRLYLESGAIEVEENRDYSKASEAYAKAIRVASTIKNADLQAAGLVNLMQLALHEGDYFSVIKFGHVAEKLLASAKQAWRQLNIYINWGSALMNMGQYEEAFKMFSDAVELSRAKFGNRQLGLLLANRAETSRHLRHEDMLAFLDEAVDEYQDDPNNFYAGLAYAYRALAFIDMDRPDDALIDAQAALRISQYNKDDELEALAQMAMARIGRATNSIGDAKTTSSRAHEILEQFEWNIEEFDLEILLIRAQVLYDSGDNGGARKVIKRAHEMLDERANKITDERLRNSYLTQVKVNAAIIDLWHLLKRDRVGDDENRALNAFISQYIQMLNAPHSHSDRDSSLPKELQYFIDDDLHDLIKQRSQSLNYDALMKFIESSATDLGQAPVGAISMPFPVEDSYVSTVRLKANWVEVLSMLLTREIIVAKNMNDEVPEMWAEGIHWNPRFSEEGHPEADVEFNLGSILGPVLFQFAAKMAQYEDITFSTHYKFLMSDDHRLGANGELRIEYKIQPGGKLGENQFGRVTFVLMPTEDGGTLLGLRVQDRLFTKNPDAFMKEFVEGLS